MAKGIDEIDGVIGSPQILVHFTNFRKVDVMDFQQMLWLLFASQAGSPMSMNMLQQWNNQLLASSHNILQASQRICDGVAQAQARQSQICSEFCDVFSGVPIVVSVR
jgi:hypothetical protein